MYTDTLVVGIAELDLPIEVVLTGVGTLSTSVGESGEAAAVAVSPNPFSHVATVRTEASNVVYAEIVDAMGTTVRSFAADAFRGTGAVSWDGRSNSGAACADGMYFVRIRTEHGVTSVPLVLQR